MSDALRAYFDQQHEEFEEAVRDSIQACDGDPIAALRSAVIANTFLMEENERLKAQISTGFDRGRTRKPAPPKK
jgi:hypothetical protein